MATKIIVLKEWTTPWENGPSGVLRNFTEHDLRQLAEGAGPVRRVILELRRRESAPNFTSPARRIWGPCVLITEFWCDGGIDQHVRTKQQLTPTQRALLVDAANVTELLAVSRREELSRSDPAARGRLYEHAGEKKTLRQWARDRRCAVNYFILYERVVIGRWPLEEALTSRAMLAPIRLGRAAPDQDS